MILIRKPKCWRINVSVSPVRSILLRYIMILRMTFLKKEIGIFNNFEKKYGLGKVKTKTARLRLADTKTSQRRRKSF